MLVALAQSGLIANPRVAQGMALAAPTVVTVCLWLWPRVLKRFDMWQLRRSISKYRALINNKDVQVEDAVKNQILGWLNSAELWLAEQVLSTEHMPTPVPIAAARGARKPATARKETI